MEERGRGNKRVKFTGENSHPPNTVRNARLMRGSIPPAAARWQHSVTLVASEPSAHILRARFPTVTRGNGTHKDLANAILIKV